MTPTARGPEWLLEQWSSRLAAGYEAMAGEPLALRPAPAPAMLSEPLVWRQPLDAADGAWVEVSVPAAAWRQLGGRILAAAGIEEAADEDTKPTYFEVLQQSLSGLASALSAALGREVGCGKGSESAWTPPSLGIQLSAGGADYVCGFSASDALLQVLQPKAEPAPAPAPAAAAAPGAPAAVPSALELIYDVELPLSVSFGRAYLPIKEVVKLTSGSIVELNRGIAEPVELIVNNCVIARGEVVVVEGNYGVRIVEIVNRSERLRTLH